jgi:hypothetical protein
MRIRPMVLMTCMLTSSLLACSDDGNTENATGDGDGDPATETTTAEGDGDPTTGDGDPTTTGDGDGDPTTTGDGDGDPTTTGDGDGDGDPTTTGDGDGDGDPTTTGDGDGDGDPTTGDGDGDPTTGDGDGDGDMMCSGQNESCAQGQMCCGNLDCCQGIPVPPGAEYCSNMCPISDRERKYGFASVDSQWVLDQLTALDLSTWSYKDGKDGYARHIGPMAQDFHAAFGVGASDKFIFQIDADGVSFAAIQALDAKVDELEAENQQLRTALKDLEARLAELEKAK